jgi:TonB family protein
MARHPMFQPDPPPHRPLADEDPSLQRESSDRAGLRHFSFRMATEGETWSADLALDLLLNEIVEQACLATAASGAAIALPRDGEFVCRAASGNAPDLGVRVEANSGLSGACLQTGEVQHCEDCENDPRVDPGVCRQLNVRSIVVMPLRKGREFVGLFEIFSPHPYAFSPRDVETLDSLSRGVMDSVDSPAPPPASGAEQQAPQQQELKADVVPEPQSPVIEPWAPPPSPPPAIEAWVPPASQAAEPEELPEFPAESREQFAEMFRQDLEREAEMPSVPAGRSSEPSAELEWTPEVEQSSEAEPSKPQHQSSAEIFSSYPQRKKRSRDYLTAILTVLVVSLALLLGWMLGRVGWITGFAGLISHTSTVQAPGASTTAEPGTSAASEETATEPSAAQSDDNAAATKPTNTAEASPKSSTKTKTAAESSPDGLLIYQGGKLIFQQQAAGTRSAAASARLQPNEQPSNDPPDVVIHPVPVSPQAAQAYLLKRVEPEYPEKARRQRIQGLVVLEALVGKDGAIQELRAIRGNSVLVTAAADAVKQWKFKPYAPKGTPVEFETRISVNFALP